MGDTASNPWSGRPPARSVAGCVGSTAFTVQTGDWADVLPELAPELAALLAPPVSVSGNPVGGAAPVDERRRAELARYRLNMASVPPYGRQRRSARVG
jgi:hypothetical protein